jgi:hypothetical protein
MTHWRLPLSLEEGRGPPDRQVSWLRINVDGIPSQGDAAPVDLIPDSPVTVTGSRRTRTGFPFQLETSSHLSVSLLVRRCWLPPPPFRR